MWRWVKSLMIGRERELPLAKRDLLVHAHVDMLPTRWTEQAFSTAAHWMAERNTGDPAQGHSGRQVGVSGIGLYS
jgi:hypothetical protein